MPKGILFWVVFVVLVLVAGWAAYPFQRASAAMLALLILIAILGWAVFGPIVQ